MTIFAGAFSFDPNTPLPYALRSALRQHVTRSADAVAEVDQPGVYLAKVDIGTFGAGGLHTDAAGNTTAIAGEPLLSDGEGDLAWNREKDMAILHPLLAEGSHDGLRRARGTFCGVHYNAGRRECSIFVDKVGVRPVYMWVGPTFAVFASALRVLEAVTQVPKEFDVRGVTEIAFFGFPMADRTPYLGISMLMPGELVRFSADGAARERYFRWDGPLNAPQSHGRVGEPELRRIHGRHQAPPAHRKDRRGFPERGPRFARHRRRPACRSAATSIQSITLPTAPRTRYSRRLSPNSLGSTTRRSRPTPAWWSGAPPQGPKSQSGLPRRSPRSIRAQGRRYCGRATAAASR